MSEKRTSTTAADWLVGGDFPRRNTLRAAFLLDGRMTMLEMCCRFLAAREYIHIVAWGMTPDLAMVRGKHHHAATGSWREQKTLFKWLRSKGLTDADLQFWQNCEVLSLLNILKYVRSKGVEVRVILWDALTFPFQEGPKQVKAKLDELGVLCMLDDSHRTLDHPIASQHQKAAVVDGRYAFVGGIDVMAEGDGEHDRWDTKGHSYDNLLRRKKNGDAVHGWHDVHILFEGTAVADVEQNFRQRWNDVVERRKLDPKYLLPEPPAQPAEAPVQREKIDMQVVRTIPAHTYAFTPEEGIATILEAYQQAFSHAKHSIYIENQYFWRRTFLGLETPLLGPPTEFMEQLFATLADALRRGVTVTMVLPDKPNVGREFTDDGLQYLWELAPAAVASGTLQVYTLASSGQSAGNTYYRPIYVHAKVAIVDDLWVTLGSANLNNRGMRDDAELNVALWQPSMAHGMRMLLMAEHLGLVDEDALFRIVETMGCTDPTNALGRLDFSLRRPWKRLQRLLGDPYQATAIFAQQAKANLEAIRNQQPLIGHIVPYIRHDRAQEAGLQVDAVNGWLAGLARNTILSDNQQEEDVTTSAT